ncbi:tripartite tricarboxylate transporter permease [Aureimonas fodinaquatilis]|uniref:Tripartite tricarboxylate transporter permease n=1 Tax=Aureimonas fodinaquatilis TaxID=2565783 RepID=A0A5B0DSI3_9HYPH|nr:tripartite tricarboxylate transporter permease [Aureimonas fodinaquatilis]KAA0969767.1 tripartite tricarboxylate transporter permease [Aureimonas fodinaquatilis]
MLDGLILGFQVALSVDNLLYCLLGVTLGTLIGVLPGVGPLVTIALLLPLTFGLSPEAALIMLAGIYYGASYGGSTTAILVNLPGESSSVVTCLDGYQMARNGRAGPALAIAALGSFVAGCIGTLAIALFAPMLGRAALSFGAAEYTSLIIMALVATAILVHGALVKGLLMALLGILIGLIGMDLNSGTLRYTFGMTSLMDGIDFVVVAVGMFAFSEIVTQLWNARSEIPVATKVASLMPSRAELKASAMPIMRGTGVGMFFGILPGIGTTISSFASYMLEQRVAKDPSRFGKGAIEGVAGPESANNAAAQVSFIPTLTLGVPGSATMALMLGALMLQGITPGPNMITERPALFWGLVASMWIGNVLLVVLNLPLIRVWVALLKVPYAWLYPIILSLACFGIYSLSNSSFDVLLGALFGLFGYLAIKIDCSPAPFILGLVLGPMLEENVRRALLISHGDASTFVSSPISATFLGATLLLLVLMILPAIRKRHQKLDLELE